MTMRNRKNVIVAFVLVAVMLMAVGFAALTDSLVLDGEAHVLPTEAGEEFDKDVYFSNATTSSTNITDNTRTVDTFTFENNDDTVNYKVNRLALKGEYVFYKFTIKNDSTEFDAKITIDENYPTNNNNTAFSVQYFYGSETNTDASNAVVPAGGTYDVYVKVTLLVEPQADLSGVFTMYYTATSQPKAANP